MEEDKKPKEVGLYFAKSNEKYSWWNLLIQIDGSPPWLYISHIVYRKSREISKDPRNAGSGIIWGPKIEEPK